MNNFDFVKTFPLIRGSDGQLYTVCSQQELDWQIANRGATLVGTALHLTSEDCSKRYPRLHRQIMSMAYSADEAGQRIAHYRWMQKLGRSSIDAPLIRKAAQVMRWKTAHHRQMAKRRKTDSSPLTSA